MNWYYVADGKQVGPVTDADFQNLLTAGTVTPATLVWREGMTDWKPYRQVAVPATPPVAGGVLCAECGQSFALENVVQFGSVWVCAGCKPTYVQKVREGVATPIGSAGTASIEEVSARDYTVDIGATISAAWQMYKSRFGSILGATLTALGLTFLCSLIPFGIGALASLILTGPLMGGLFLVLARHVRGEDPPVGDVFNGFKNHFKNLMLTNIVKGMLIGIAFIPAIILGVVAVIGILAQNKGGGKFHFEFTALIGLAIAAGVLGILAAIYLQVSWMFALPLAADKQLSFWPALQLSRKVVGKHWWGTFGLVFVAGLVTALGVFACGIGLLFTMPISFLVLMHQYEKVFGDLAPQGQ